MLIDLIAGARPNFMKIAPIINAIKCIPSEELKYRLIHTGQHFDKNMSDSFFIQLGLPTPDINLNAGGGSQAEQTAKIMIGYEKVIEVLKPDLCLVVGDVTSTMACSIVAKKMQIKVAHVEAGIRSNDMSMPEEINRLVTDSISDFYFTTSEFANSNLKRSGIKESQIFFVGNTMIDTLLLNISKFIKPKIWDETKLIIKNYLVLTLHRPANVDDKLKLKELVEAIVNNSNNIPIIFPVHPRTQKILANLEIGYDNLILIEPLSYLEFNYLVQNSKAVITDSGGITEETTVMGVPCMTLRENTERPETITIGTNELLGINSKAIKPAMDKLFSGKWKTGNIPKYWDGKTGERIIDVILKLKNDKCFVK